MEQEKRIFTEQEQAILRIAQKNLPDTLTPYADIAAMVGCDEATVLDLLRELKESGAIRRLGASLKHQRAGYAHNSMVAWRVRDEAQADEAGQTAATHPLISHCYHRPSTAPDWPYSFFTMIHGRNPEEYLEVIEWLRANSALQEYAVLRSVKELKKISMTYF